MQQAENDKNQEPNVPKAADHPETPARTKAAAEGGENSTQQPQFNPGIQMPESPKVELPKGGGAINGIGEKFQANPVTGTGSFTVPIALSPGRNGFTPPLTLSYDSGAGNSPYGLGWNVGLPHITRKTSKGIPRYQDAEESDTFLFSGAEDLVPYLEPSGSDWIRSVRTEGNYQVHRYLPRIEGLFAWIERWRHETTHESYWLTITRDNVTTRFGYSDNSRIQDPAHPTHVFQWNIDKTWDDKGNVIEYTYAVEDTIGVNEADVQERHRFDQSAFSMRYLKHVRYGNTKMHDGSGTLPGNNEWLFHLVLDYGEHDQASPELTPTAGMDWEVRQDPFSTYRAGFEIRTWRLCKRFLMFHNIAELADDGAGNAVPVLVKATELAHDANPLNSRLLSATHRCYDPVAGTDEAYPPVSFTYSEAIQDTTVHQLELDDLDELPGGIGNRQFFWNDLEGVGISGILADDGNGWYYKRNLGDRNGYVSQPPASLPPPEVHFEPFHQVGEKPVPGAAQQLGDVDGDGRQEVVLHEEPLHGRFEMQMNGEWKHFQAFDPLPNIDWQDPNMRMLDLDGDGLADILLTTDHCLRWYQNEEGRGYADAGEIPRPVDEANGPALVFANREQSIYTADMSGDGLTDLVRVCNGEVCYWPNLGYGRFGAKITLGGNPFFDTPDQFDQKRIRLADVDGSGTTDVVYLGGDKVTWWANQSGNTLSAETELLNVPDIDNAVSVNVLDILGRGTGCLVWSSPLAGNQGMQVRYIDLMGQKPYLLIAMNNNMGGEHRFRYTSSTESYLRDRRAGTPWVTKLHFPVQVLTRAETFDHISGTRFISRYAYHHGFYDRHEREFRGFGMVEQWDTEEIDYFGQAGLFPVGTNENDTYIVQPVYTKTWFHNGYFEERGSVSQQFQHEYNRTDTDAWPLPDSELPGGLPAEESQEAHRALKGQALRSEVYHVNADGSISDPYTVTETNFQVKLIQPRGENEYASFQTFPNETLTYTYERNMADPRITQQLVIDTDAYGLPLFSATVAYPRRGSGHPTQESRPRITVTQQEYIHKTNSNTQLRIGIPYRVRAWELTGVTLPTNDAFRSGTSGNLYTAFTGASTIDYATSPTYTAPQKRQIAEVEAEYYNDAVTAPEPLGQASFRALPHRSYQLALTGTMKAAVFGSYPIVSDANLASRGGYVKRGSNFYIPSSIYLFRDQQFFIIEEVTDPFGNSLIIDFDTYGLLPVQTEDAYENTIVAELDYRVLAPWHMTDANNNHQQVAFDERGMVVHTAVMGKTGGGEGDTLSDPTTITEYDLFNWSSNGKPNFVRSRMREDHQSPTTRWLETYTYSDGLGRELLQKVIAEDGDAFTFVNGVLQYTIGGDPLVQATTNRWVGTGRVVYNNKGMIVKQYEPYFSNTHEYENESEARTFGASPLLIYDPLGRNTRIHYPDGTFEKVTFDCWEQANYDRNDTAVDSDWYVQRNSPSPAAPEPTDPDERAAWLAAKHYETPQVLNLDVLGRMYRTRDDNGSYDGVSPSPLYYDTVYDLDMEGKQRSYTNALSQTTTFQYDMRTAGDGGGTLLVTSSPDSGSRTVLIDVSGKPLYAWDARGHFFEYFYDDLQRLVKSEVTVSGITSVREFRVYGDNCDYVSPETDNVNGQLIRVFDQAGVVQTDAYDFKGNSLRSKRLYIKNVQDRGEWSAEAAFTDIADIDSDPNGVLESSAYTTEIVVDALNRPTESTLAEGTIVYPTYNKGNLLETLEADLTYELTTRTFVSNIDYNAKGQRTHIVYGNGARTAYTYDENTFRLTQLRSTRNSGADVLQELNYTFDPVGNITEMRDNAQQTLYFDNAVVSSNSKYSYDALYRLLRGTGREQTSAGFPRWNVIPGAQPVPNSATSAAVSYTEDYTYDALGNILQLFHNASGNTWTRGYHYDTSVNNRLLKSSLPGDTIGNPTTYSVSYTHDAHGNITSMPSSTNMVWDENDQLIEVTLQGGGTAYFRYDSEGNRVRKAKVFIMTEDRKYIGAAEIFEEKFSNGTVKTAVSSVHISDDTGRIAWIESKYKAFSRFITPVITIRYQLSNHLQSASLELDASAAILSYEEFHPFGTTAYQAHKNTSEASLKRYRYVSKERDTETGLDYLGARYYAPWLGRFISTDPLASKHANESSYVYVSNSPVVYVDPDGREKIVVTGGEYDSEKRYKFNFVEPAIKQLKTYKAEAGDEQVTWAIMNTGYTDEQIESFRSTAKELGVELVLLNSADDLALYLNKKTTKPYGGARGTPISPEEKIETVSDERKKDLVTDVSIFGHGFVGSMEFGYRQTNSTEFSFGIDDIAKLNSEAFNNEVCGIEIYTCNAATPTDSAEKDLWSSFAGELAKQTKTYVTGYQRRTDYAKINVGEDNWDKWNRYRNGYNTDGSQRLPSAGTQTGGKPSKRWAFDKTVKKEEKE